MILDEPRTPGSGSPTTAPAGASRAWQEKVILRLRDGLGTTSSAPPTSSSRRSTGFFLRGRWRRTTSRPVRRWGRAFATVRSSALRCGRRNTAATSGIALSDVCGMEPFLKDFDMYFCKLFDGARHDSGDPFVWGERMIEHWTKNKFRPRSKSLIFSRRSPIPRARTLAALPRPRGAGFQDRHQPHERPRSHAPQRRHQDGARERSTGREDLGRPEKGMCEDESYLNYC